MYFESFRDLLYMDGHGSFVWAAYGITLVVVLAMLLGPRRRTARRLQQIRGDIRRREGQSERVEES